jgi:hypothetical protein
MTWLLRVRSWRFDNYEPSAGKDARRHFVSVEFNSLLQSLRKGAKPAKGKW